MITRRSQITRLASMILMLALCGGCSNGSGTPGASNSAAIGGVTASPELANQIQVEIQAGVNADPQYKLSNDELADLKSQDLVSEADAAALELYIVQ